MKIFHFARNEISCKHPLEQYRTALLGLLGLEYLHNIIELNWKNT